MEVETVHFLFNKNHNNHEKTDKSRTKIFSSTIHMEQRYRLIIKLILEKGSAMSSKGRSI